LSYATLSLVENVMLPPDFSGDYQSLTTYQHALELLEVVGIRSMPKRSRPIFLADKNSVSPSPGLW